MAYRTYLESKYDEYLALEESSTNTNEVFKILGMRRALRDVLKTLPDSTGIKYD
jgi:hypothetical protein